MYDVETLHIGETLDGLGFDALAGLVGVDTVSLCVAGLAYMKFSVLIACRHLPLSSSAVNSTTKFLWGSLCLFMLPTARLLVIKALTRAKSTKAKASFLCHFLKEWPSEIENRARSWSNRSTPCIPLLYSATQAGAGYFT
jgi:hypothetical protein